LDTSMIAVLMAKRTVLLINKENMEMKNIFKDIDEQVTDIIKYFYKKIR